MFFLFIPILVHIRSNLFAYKLKRLTQCIIFIKKVLVQLSYYILKTVTDSFYTAMSRYRKAICRYIYVYIKFSVYAKVREEDFLFTYTYCVLYFLIQLVVISQNNIQATNHRHESYKLDYTLRCDLLIVNINLPTNDDILTKVIVNRKFWIDYLLD